MTRPSRTSGPRQDIDVIAIEGVGPTYAARLKKAGVKTAQELLRADGKELARRTRIPAVEVAKWQDMADLMHLPGIGPQFAEVLVRVKVNSVVELAHLEPAALRQRLDSYLDGLDSTVVGRRPSKRELRKWIRSAAEIAPPPEGAARSVARAAREPDVPANPVLTGKGVVAAARHKGRVRPLDCDKCGATLLIAQGVKSATCPYCADHLDVKAGDDGQFVPAVDAARHAEAARQEAARSFLSRFARGRAQTGLPPRAARETAPRSWHRRLFRRNGAAQDATGQAAPADPDEATWFSMIPQALRKLESATCANCGHGFRVRPGQSKATCPKCHSRLALVPPGEAGKGMAAAGRAAARQERRQAKAQARMARAKAKVAAREEARRRKQQARIEKQQSGPKVPLRGKRQEAAPAAAKGRSGDSGDDQQRGGDAKAARAKAKEEARAANAKEEARAAKAKDRQEAKAARAKARQEARAARAKMKEQALEQRRKDQEQALEERAKKKQEAHAARAAKDAAPTHAERSAGPKGKARAQAAKAEGGPGIWLASVAKGTGARRPDGWAQAQDKPRFAKVDTSDHMRFRLLDGRSPFARLPEDEHLHEPARLPGGKSPFVRLPEDQATEPAPRLVDGRSAFAKLPEDRRQATARLQAFGHRPGETYVTPGGFEIKEDIIETEAPAARALGRGTDQRELRRQQRERRSQRRARRKQERKARVEAVRKAAQERRARRDAAPSSRWRRRQEAPATERPALVARRAMSKPASPEVAAVANEEPKRSWRERLLGAGKAKDAADPRQRQRDEDKRRAIEEKARAKERAALDKDRRRQEKERRRAEAQRLREERRSKPAKAFAGAAGGQALSSPAAKGESGGEQAAKAKAADKQQAAKAKAAAKEEAAKAKANAKEDAARAKSAAQKHEARAGAKAEKAKARQAREAAAQAAKQDRRAAAAARRDARAKERAAVKAARQEMRRRRSEERAKARDERRIQKEERKRHGKPAPQLEETPGPSGGQAGQDAGAAVSSDGAATPPMSSAKAQSAGSRRARQAAAGPAGEGAQEPRAADAPGETSVPGAPAVASAAAEAEASRREARAAERDAERQRAMAAKEAAAQEKALLRRQVAVERKAAREARKQRKMADKAARREQAHAKAQARKAAREQRLAQRERERATAAARRIDAKAMAKLAKAERETAAHAVAPARPSGRGPGAGRPEVAGREGRPEARAARDQLEYDRAKIDALLRRHGDEVRRRR